MQERIRPATLNDATQCLAIYAPAVESSLASFELTAPTLAEFEQRIQTKLQSHAWLVIEVDDNITGYAYAGRFSGRAAYDHSVETSIYLDPQYQGQGFGKRLYQALLAQLIDQGYCQAFAGITLPNAPSIGLHEAVGFTYTGVFPKAGYKFNDWHDVGWWYRELRTGTPTPLKLP